jgi:hypothetical protein
VGLQPRGGSQGPGAWDHLAKGVRNALSDLVSRVLLGESHTAPEHGHADKFDKGMDR